MKSLLFYLPQQTIFPGRLKSEIKSPTKTSNLNPRRCEATTQVHLQYVDVKYIVHFPIFHFPSSPAIILIRKYILTPRIRDSSSSVTKNRANTLSNGWIAC